MRKKVLSKTLDFKSWSPSNEDVVIKVSLKGDL